MSTRGTDWRKIRINKDTWDKFEHACREINGSKDRSDDIRRYVEGVVAEWEARPAPPREDEA